MTRPALNAARIVWVVVGAIVLSLGIGFLGFPVFVGLFGAAIDIGYAFLLATAVDVVLAGIFVAGLLIARRRADGTLRAIPPAIAAGLLAPASIVGGNLVFAVAAR